MPDLDLRLIRAGAGLLGLALLFSMWASPDRLLSLPWFLIAIVGVLVVLVVTGQWLPFFARKVSSVRSDELLDALDDLRGTPLRAELGSHWGPGA